MISERTSPCDDQAYLPMMRFSGCKSMGARQRVALLLSIIPITAQVPPAADADQNLSPEEKYRKARQLYIKAEQLEEGNSDRRELEGEIVSMVSTVLLDPETPDNIFLNSARFGIAVAANSEVSRWVVSVVDTVLNSNRAPKLVGSEEEGGWWLEIIESLIVEGQYDRALMRVNQGLSRGLGGLRMTLAKMLLVGDGSDYRSLLGDLRNSDVEEDLEEVKLFLFRIEDALTERQREKNAVLKPLQETSPEDHLDHPDHPDHLDHLDELGHPDNPDHPVHLDHLDHLHLMFEDLGIYPSKYQRPIWLVPGLRAAPVWTEEEAGVGYHLARLRESWEEIRKEAFQLVKEVATGNWTRGEVDLEKDGRWHQLVLFGKGYESFPSRICKVAKKSCKLLKLFPEALNCPTGTIKFSVIESSAHVLPHCGQTNSKLRAHLALSVPQGQTQEERPRMRVGSETVHWREGEVIIFDDSFEHEVWNETNDTRIVLIVDFNHPELDEDARIEQDESYEAVGWAVDGPLFKMTKKKGTSGANQPRSNQEDDKDEL